jgi:hypothetical protein
MNSYKAFMKMFAGSLALALIINGCQSGSSTFSPITPTEIPHSFSSADWATVLTAIVTPDGYVKWEMIQSDDGTIKGALLRYLGLLSVVSPANHPELFATDRDRLAYWINAYNATCIYAVIKHNYPAQPRDVMFSDEQFAFGEQSMSLGDLVQTQIEPAADPRVFFALNFCSTSCPPLRSEPFDGAVLSAELVDQGQRYLSDPRAAVRDGDAVKLSDLLTTMHAYDFMAGYKKWFGTPPNGILQALQPYVQSDSPIVGATRVENLGFDWSLNRPPR